MHATSLQDRHQKALEYIIKQDQGGWWPYHPGQRPSVEATAWCTIALCKQVKIGKSVGSYLLATQNADGGWSTAPGIGQSDWGTSLALLTLGILSRELAGGQDSDFRKSCQRGISLLMARRAQLYTAIGSVILFLLQGPDVLDYPRGWPWTAGCFHWVEPTSYTLLALKLMPGDQDPEVRDAVKQASTYLLSVACTGGGWNYGNNITLGAHLPPYPVTTAEVITALQDWPDHKAVKEALTFLNSAAPAQATIMSLSWAILAKNALGEDVSGEISSLVDQQHPDGSFGDNLLLSGLATCALAAGDNRNPLKFGAPASPATEVNK